jgi:hypothetical protein
MRSLRHTVARTKCRGIAGHVERPSIPDAVATPSMTVVLDARDRPLRSGGRVGAASVRQAARLVTSRTR